VVAAAVVIVSGCGGLALGASEAGQPGGAAGHGTLAAVAPVPGGQGTAGPVRPRGRVLAGKVVGIDPGHNGGNFTHPSVIDRKVWNGRAWENCNTTGTATNAGYTEARFNFAVAVDLRADLIAAGARVAMTRTSDNGVGPCVNKRAAIIEAAHANAAIAIHADGGPPGGRGFAILVPVADGPNDSVVGPSGLLGEDVRAGLLAGTALPPSDYDGVNGFKTRDDLAGLNLARVPTVLVEVGNMRNPTDAALLTSASFQRRVAAALAAAVIRFLG
jgi:N-acetylmuramoyl-L-alanine amidase